MNSFGLNAFNITSLVVCAQDVNGAHTGTPVELANGQTCEIDPESENLTQMGYGKTVELATILMHVNFSLSQGGIDLTAWPILAGATLGAYGSTPNQYQVAKRLSGGAGLPYFGLIGAAASTGGANLLFGLPHAKLDNMPSLNVEQNAFVIGEAAGKSIANPSGIADLPLVIKRYETAGAITLTSVYFDSFFEISS